MAKSSIAKMPGAAGGKAPVDAQAQMLAAFATKLDGIASIVAKLAAVIAPDQDARDPGRTPRPAAAFTASPRTRQAAPEPDDAPEVARFAAHGPRVVKAARAAHAQALAISAGPRGRDAVRRGGGIAQFVASHPDVIEAMQTAGATFGAILPPVVPSQAVRDEFPILERPPVRRGGVRAPTSFGRGAA